MAQYTVYAFSTSAPVPACVVRITQNGIDVSTKLTGGIPITTGADGIFTATLSAGAELTATLPAGTYVVIANAPGFAPYLKEIQIGGERLATLTIDLVPIEFDEQNYGSIEYGGSSYVSPLYPVTIEVPGASGSAGWEIIEASVTNDEGLTTLIEVEVIDGQALINLQARLILEPLLHLVGDDAIGLVDENFSGQFETSFASLTATGRVPLPGTITVQSANIAPSLDTNDLQNFTNDGGLASWITPWGELPVFQGHYADAMIWLPVAGAGNYVLKAVFSDINRANPTTESIPLPADLFEAKKAVKIRIPAAPAGKHYAQLHIEQGGVVQTKELTVRYHG